MILDILPQFAAAGSVAAITKIRLAIDDAAEAGKLNAEAAQAFQVILSQAAVAIADRGERPAAAPAKAAAKPVAERHAATIRSCRRTDFSDTGPQLRGDLEVSGHGIISFRVKLDGGGSEKGFRRAVDALGAIEPGDMVSRVVAVELAPWVNAMGESKTLVNRWHPADDAPAPAASAPRGPRKTAASKINGGGGLDDTMF